MKRLFTTHRLWFFWIVFARATTGNAAAEPSRFQCIDPQPASGGSLAVVVADVPLVHTAQFLAWQPRADLAADPAAQARLALTNLAAVLRAGGSDLSQVVKLNVYLARDDLKAVVQGALAGGLGGSVSNLPAISFVTGALPDPAALVALDAVAIASRHSTNAGVELVALNGSDRGVNVAAVLPAGPKLYVSGMADTNDLPVATRKTLEKLLSALEQLGSGRADIVQLKAFLQPMTQSGIVREEILKFFSGKAPPVVFVEWLSPPPNPPIEIELIAQAHGDLKSQSNPITFLTPSGTTSTKVFSRVARVNYGRQIYISGLYGASAGGAEEVRSLFRSLGEVLKKTGGDFDHLVKATYYVSDDEASNQLNLVRPEFYPPQRPPAASKARVRGVGRDGRSATLDMIAIAP